MVDIPYTVAIIGLGNIGFLYDRNLPAHSHVLTHARAFSQHPDFRLLAAIDPEPELRSEFEHSFNVSTYKSIADIPSVIKPDVFVVASPTETHYDLIMSILYRYTPRAILCEKPISYSIDVTREIEERCRSVGVSLYVNFIRRADPGLLEIKSRIENGMIAMPFKAVAWYSKGLLHNGVHLADLLGFWFGPILDMNLVALGRRIGEYDAESDLRLEFAMGSALFCAAREEDYSHYTLEVVAANGRLRYEKSGEIQWQAAVDHPSLSSHRQLDTALEVIPNDMNKYQYRIVDQLSLALRGRSNSLCTGTCSILTQQWLTRAIIDKNQGENACNH
jgi:predicted dehydrogenase